MRKCGSSSSLLVRRLRWAGLASLGGNDYGRRYFTCIGTSFGASNCLASMEPLGVFRFVSSVNATGIHAIPPVFRSTSMSRYPSSIISHLRERP